MVVPTPELFDPSIDVHHMSYLWVVVVTSLETLRPRSTESYCTLIYNGFTCDSFFICNLHVLCFISLLVVWARLTTSVLLSHSGTQTGPYGGAKKMM
jgi:hypothetical protein